MGNGLVEFLEWVRQGHFRFYQERDLILDLYHNGLPGVLLGMLMVASLVVFLLAIFHVIPEKKHVVRVLLGLGLAALLLGAGTSYFHFRRLPAVESRIIRETAGPLPANDAQRAAVVALPLVVGGLTFVGDTAGCLYMAIFWGAGLFTKKKRKSQ
jgi:hypothetical protein